jgi:hypothetical protein
MGKRETKGRLKHRLWLRRSEVWGRWVVRRALK